MFVKRTGLAGGPVAAYNLDRVTFQRRTKSKRRSESSRQKSRVKASSAFSTNDYIKSRGITKSYIYGLGAPNSAKALAPHGGKVSGVRIRKSRSRSEK